MTAILLNAPIETAAFTNCSAFRMGHLVVVRCYGNFANGWASIGTLPESMRPASIVAAATVAGSGNGKAGILRVNPNGAVEHYQGEGAAKQYVGTMTYQV